MEDQGNLFASPKRPLRLRLSVGHEWQVDDDTFSVQASVFGTKSSDPLWVAHSTWGGPHGSIISRHVAEAHLAQWYGPRWMVEPISFTPAEWEQRLFEM